MVDTGLVGREHIIALRDTPKENVNRVVDGSHMLRDRSLLDKSISYIFIHSSAYTRHFQRQCTLGLRE